MIKNMVAGLSQSDIVVLLLSAAKGEFEAGITPGSGYTRQFATIAYTLGNHRIVVAVNKMDHNSVNYSQKRFKEVETEAQKFLDKIGYIAAKVIPISGFAGENLTQQSSQMPWYRGQSLLEALDELGSQIGVQRLANAAKPLRLPVINVYKIGGIGTVIGGKVLSGVLKAN